jgi:hypothetical protein
MGRQLSCRQRGRPVEFAAMTRRPTVPIRLIADGCACARFISIIAT